MADRQALLVALLAIAATGCVVDQQRTEQLRRGPGASATSPSGSASTRSATGSSASLPDEPIARPVLGGTTASRVSVSVQSLGPITYDGMSVPMVSPDGLFIATQTPPAPRRQWRLAIDGEPAPRGEPMPTVAIARLRDNLALPAQSTEVFDHDAPILLGRDAGPRGVLIESPRPDGSRWIGMASWSDQQAAVTWLVRGRAVAAHAVLGPAGGLLYARRPANDALARFSLVHRDPAGVERVLELPDAHLVYPLLAPDQRHATCLAVADSGAIALLLIDLSTASMGTPGRVVRRYDLASAGGLEGAAQIVAASQSAVAGLSAADALATGSPLPTSDPMPGLGPFFFHPAMDRMAAIDAHRRTLVALAPGSVAAADAGDGRALCSTPDGLVLWTPGPQAGRGTATRVLSEDYLPRRTASTDRPFVLLAPARRSPTSLTAYGLVPR